MTRGITIKPLLKYMVSIDFVFICTWIMLSFILGGDVPRHLITGRGILLRLGIARAAFADMGGDFSTAFWAGRLEFIKCGILETISTSSFINSLLIS